MRASLTGSWGFPPFFLVFSDMLCNTSRPRSASCYRKTLHFKRCGLKKYGEKYAKMKCLITLYTPTLETLSRPRYIFVIFSEILTFLDSFL